VFRGEKNLELLARKNFSTSKKLRSHSLFLWATKIFGIMGEENFWSSVSVEKKFYWYNGREKIFGFLFLLETSVLGIMGEKKFLVFCVLEKIVFGIWA
jgi:hypothetical protein